MHDLSPALGDFAAANEAGGSISVRFGDGAGGFGGGSEVAVGAVPDSRPASVAFGDVGGAGGLTPSGLPGLGPLVPHPAAPLV